QRGVKEAGRKRQCHCQGGQCRVRPLVLPEVVKLLLRLRGRPGGHLARIVASRSCENIGEQTERPIRVSPLTGRTRGMSTSAFSRMRNQLGPLTIEVLAEGMDN